MAASAQADKAFESHFESQLQRPIASKGLAKEVRAHIQYSAGKESVRRRAAAAAQAAATAAEYVEGDSDGGSDGLSHRRGVAPHRHTTRAMRAGLVPLVVSVRPWVPALHVLDAAPVQLCKGVYVGSAKWARDHAWLASHGVTGLVNVGWFTQARGRPTTRATYHVCLEDPDTPLARCSRALPAAQVSDLAVALSEIHEGFPSVRGELEQAGAALVVCSTGQVARLGTAAAILTHFRLSVKEQRAVCAAATCALASDKRTGKHKGCAAGSNPAITHIHISSLVQH